VLAKFQNGVSKVKVYPPLTDVDINIFKRLLL